MEKNRADIIQRYIDGYNEFDIDKMVYHLDDNIVFQNIQDGKVNMTIHGITDFRKQAEEAKTYFESRQQKIAVIKHMGNQTEIDVEYTAVLAIDLPNGLKKGQTLKLKGKSIFIFDGSKIIKLTDIS